MTSESSFFHGVPPDEPKPDADGWIEWHGGECPVPPDSACDIMLRCGEVHRDEAPQSWAWELYGHLWDIAAYRLCPPAKPKRQAWVNVYEGGEGAFQTKEIAEDEATTGRIACVPIYWPDDAPWPWGDE